MNPLKAMSSALEALVARTSPAVVAVERGPGQGSGIVFTPDGYVLTNRHVVRGRGQLSVSFADGDSVSAELIGSDDRTDLAVLRVEARDLSLLPLADPDSIKVGQLVVAIGNPLRFERSVSLGVVSALDRSLPTGGGNLLEALIQTDAAINPGNSGGPLLDVDGNVVGINTAIVPYAQGIGFAIPAKTASWIAAVLMQKGEVQRPYLGISARGEDLARALKNELGRARAIRVLKVGPDTPASQAGLEDGDLLLAANGSALGSVDDLQRVMVLERNQRLEVEVLRRGARRSLRVNV